MAAWIISVVVETIVGDTVASQLTVQPPVSRLFPSSDHCRQSELGQTGMAPSGFSYTQLSTELAVPHTVAPPSS